MLPRVLVCPLQGVRSRRAASTRSPPSLSMVGEDGGQEGSVGLGRWLGTMSLRSLLAMETGGVRG